MTEDREYTIEYELYKLDNSFKQEKNVINYVNQAQDFYNGEQYPNENFNNMIRVTMNICSFAATIKASKLCGTPIYLTYTADDNSTDCTALRQFDEYNQSKIRIKSSNYQAALNGFVNGTEITFIRWDDDDTSYKGIYKGGLCEEHIDIRNFALANPYIQDIQNQQWVMFWEDYPVEAIKDLLEGDEETKKKKEQLITRESSNEDEYKTKEYINHGLCRLFTRFFRVDGEVYFMCSTKEVNVFEFPHHLSRKISNKLIEKIIKKYKRDLEKQNTENRGDELITDYQIDYEDIIMSSLSNNKFTDNDYKNIKEKFSLYPFAVFRPYLQNRFFYGRSDIKSLIPIQKAINFCISMMLKCIENNAYNKVFSKPDALQDQVITNEPSQVIFDYSGFTNGWGIKFAESQPLPNGLLDFSDRMLSMTRVIYGFNDVMDGSVTNQDMSGYMLQQMIKQSNTSIEQQQQLFWEYNVDKAAIRLMYYKHYVDKAKYTFELTDAEYQQEEQARMKLYNATLKGQGLPTNPNATPQDFQNPTHRTQVREITNEDLYGTSFDICIDALQGTNDSKLVEQQMWDNLLLNGGIQNISPDILAMYLQCSPNVSPRTKTALQRVIENLKNAENQQLKDQLQKLTEQTQQLMSYCKQLEAKNGYQGQYLKNLQNEFANKINQSNKMNTALMNDLTRYKQLSSQPVSEGEKKSNNATSVERTA